MNWLSYHLYPNETQDVFLARALKPFLEQHVWPNKELLAFFIRYHDEKGPHIRVRIKGNATWLEDSLRPAFEAWMADRGELLETPYIPEPTRFGGDAGLILAEEHFHLSSRVVLDRIGRDQFTYGDAMFDALRLHVITAFSAGLKRDRIQWYFGALFEQWIPLFFPSDDNSKAAELSATFDKTFDPQKVKITATLDAFWDALEAEKLDDKQPEWARWLEGNQLILNKLGPDMDKSLPSLIHLTSNRLGINNQDEVYLNYIMSKAL